MVRSGKTRGFTLIELVIVVLIVAILAAVAIPSYRRYVVRSHRVDAKTALVDLAARQERFYYSNNKYSGSLSDLNANGTMAGSLYEVSIASASTSAYLVQAKALGTQAKGDTTCATLTLNNLGAQGSTGDTANDPQCWSK
ncbi:MULTISPECIES: type IV pilin protein [Rhodanobacteraceae]|uniref:type IV pilin protein n=1 Tax=Rhodanobacteraceae TaxID=1775411 RepID=UPI00088E99B5|nr:MULTISPECIES: type IV pilin protein [Rhodanobacteraceae]SDF14907.1 type IV pilus assembly protein PilE [Dyella sp. 333MFSha]SKB82798.1 type IV pilus assembly protein PilE [Luteibacter sp. 22Crub2.1]